MHAKLVLVVFVSLQVHEIMVDKVITTKTDATVKDAAKLMNKYEIGCLVVVENGKPVGIITERDLVTRVLAKNKLPSKLKAKDVMTTPLVTITPDETLSNAARQMSRLNVRRLGVVYKGGLVGLISSKDILAITPELLETIQEKARIESGNMEETEESTPMAGYCDRCGQWSNRLKEVEGEFLCEDCRTENEHEY